MGGVTYESGTKKSDHYFNNLWHIGFDLKKEININVYIR